MCVQTVGLIQTEVERIGITTVSISLLRQVTEILRPPRALYVPFEMGYPLGLPNDRDLQHRVITQALKLLGQNSTPILSDFV